MLAIIFLLLYLTYHSALEAAHVLLAVPFALSGGIYVLYGMGYNVSVAVWVGFIALFGTAVQTAVVMLLIAASALLGIYLTEAQVPQRIAQGILDLTQNQYAVLAILNLFFLIIGLFLHSTAAIILVVPIVMPLVTAVGIDTVHFGIIVTLNLSIGQQTPPVASVLIATCSIAKANIWDVTKVNVWFIAVLLAVLLLITYVPSVPMAPVHFFYD